MTRSCTWSACFAIAALGCGGKAPPAPAVTSLGGDVARVGGAAISTVLVADVARAKDVSPKAALDGLVDDALLAAAAAEEGLGDAASARWGRTVATADLVAQRASLAGRAEGPPTDDEVATVEVLHAVILRSPTLATARGEALAERIRQAVSASTDEGTFRARAGEVQHGGAQLTVQRVPPFDASGTTADGERIDPSFVAGAFALHARGETSQVVATPFGWHVIRLLEREPSPPDVRAARKRDLEAAVFAMRARLTLGATLAVARQETHVETSVAADQLMAGAVASAP